MIGYGRVDLVQQFQLLFPHHLGEQGERLLQVFPQPEGNWIQIQLARLNFGEVQNVIDDG
jgi:hypothetical protein